jgi:hypothetical protein
MGEPGLTQVQVDQALVRLGHYRVVRTQEVGGRLGTYELSIALRETGGRNVDGGARWDGNKWVFAPLDTGVFQISRVNHRRELERMVPCVKSGTWSPYVDDHSPAEAGFCPRFEEALQFTTRELHEAIAFAEDNEVPADGSRTRFAVAAHNAGQYGALSGWRAGDVDAHTAHGDYSAWVLAQEKKVQDFLHRHENWRP